MESAKESNIVDPQLLSQISSIQRVGNENGVCDVNDVNDLLDDYLLSP